MGKYMDSSGLSHFMTKIKTWAAETFASKSHTHNYTNTRVKGNSESNYRTGDVNLTPDNIGAIKVNETGNTQKLVRPSGMRGLADVTLQALVNTTRANRLAFLPANQIIIEKTTDGGTTWVDAGISDSVKVGLFSETRPNVAIPMINGARSMLCGLRITITAMKYNVPANTPETEKYAYWNSNNVLSAERYCQLKEMYFWLSAISDTIGVKVERANGNTPNNWSVIFNDPSFYMTGWSGCDYIRFSQGVFGGGTTQVGQAWNYRITFMTKGVNGTDTMATTSTTGAQVICEIRAYGDTWWTRANEYMANDKLYLHDINKNAIFPGSILPSTNEVGDLGSSSQKWNSVHAVAFNGALTGNVTGNCSGTASNVTGTVAIANGGTGATTAAGALTNLGAVPTTRTVNGKPLSSDVNILVEDILFAEDLTDYTLQDFVNSTPWNGYDYGLCNTASATAAKTVTISDSSMEFLYDGLQVVVKFVSGNTASNITLNVNNTGACSITKNGSSNIYSNFYFPAGSIYMFTYSGNAWEITGNAVVEPLTNNEILSLWNSI